MTDTSDTEIRRGEIEDAVSKAEVGDAIRVNHKTRLPEQSALQPTCTDVERKEDGRWSYVTMFGDPLWGDDEGLVAAILETEYAESIEVQR